MDFEQRRAIVEGRPRAEARDAVADRAADADAHRIDAVLQAAVRIERDVRGRKAEVAPALVALAPRCRRQTTDSRAARRPRPRVRRRARRGSRRTTPGGPRPRAAARSRPRSRAASPCSARNAGEPRRWWPKWKSNPMVAPRMPSRPTRMRATNSSARHRGERLVEGEHQRAGEAGRREQAQLRSRVGEAEHRIGRAQHVARMRLERHGDRRGCRARAARAIAASITARWPRCTPSKLPIAATAPRSAATCGASSWTTRKGLVGLAGSVMCG